ncbi:MAG TPA: hypothetical protein VFG08_06865 [Candidatus Polarisedimenticolia bacterium]|nr:hypothetical protein [Candidatus Polarisedimenticolia bacterium]
MVHLSGKIAIRLALLAAALSGCFGAGASSGADPQPTVDQLGEIEAEGRRIARYLGALARAQDEFETQAPAGASFDRQVIVESRDGWHAIFVTAADPGLLNDQPDLVAEAVVNPDTMDIRTFRYVENPRGVQKIAGDHLLAVESALIAGAAADGASPPFDASIFFESGQLFRVYLTGKPADGMIRFGGDFRLEIERNPIRVSSIEPLHAETWPVALPAGAAGEPTAHSHLEHDLPTATDVALVMIWPTLAPHLVLTPRHIYRIEADGSIAYLGRNEPLDGGAGGAE